MEIPVYHFNDKKPTLVCSLSGADETSNICAIRNAVFEGADGFLLHLEKLKPEYQNREALTRIFRPMEDKPVGTTNYRRPDITEDERAELQKTAVLAGSGCVDVMGDMFDPSPFELTHDPEAIKKQADLIGWVHDNGAQVLMSSHILKDFMPTEQLIEQALEMESRGVDVVKLVVKVSNEDQLLEGMAATAKLHRALKKPFLHILGGPLGRAHRILAPTLGSCMVLCVQQYTPGCTLDKPMLKAVRAIWDNLDYKPARA